MYAYGCVLVQADDVDALELKMHRSIDVCIRVCTRIQADDVDNLGLTMHVSSLHRTSHA
jgi:hypothetical protein